MRDYTNPAVSLRLLKWLLNPGGLAVDYGGLEKRKYLRLDTRVKVELALYDQSKGKTVPQSAETRDVSAGGAFFPTDKTIPKDTKVKLRMTLSSETLKELTGTQGVLEIEGTVVRTGPNGMAIRFDENYDLM